MSQMPADMANDLDLLSDLVAKAKRGGADASGCDRRTFASARRISFLKSLRRAIKIQAGLIGSFLVEATQT